MSDIYYSPEKFNLEIVECLEEDLSYEFNILCVWKHKETNQLYYEKDSGCSCPSPFDDYNSVEMLEKLNLENLHQFEINVKEFPVSYDEKTKLLDKVKLLLGVK